MKINIIRIGSKYFVRSGWIFHKYFDGDHWWSTIDFSEKYTAKSSLEEAEELYKNAGKYKEFEVIK